MYTLNGVAQHFIMDLMRAMQAYTSEMEIPFAAVFYYTIVRHDLDLIKSGCYIAVTIVSDGLIVCRTCAASLCPLMIYSVIGLLSSMARTTCILLCRSASFSRT